jgi:aminoglycoside phosphotransferase (APT) family kinase protein
MSASEGWAPGLDAGGLAAWLATHVPAIEGPLMLEPIAGGQSNPTYILDAPTGRWVLRRKPLGPLLPSAHQIEREFRVLRALAGTRVPVPRALALCEDTDVLGAPFFVMEFLDGRIFADPALPGVTPAERTAMYESAIAILAELHAVDFRAVGLSDYGRSAGYLARQVTRWTKQYTASQTHTIASMDALIDWLPQHIPAEDEAAIAHGDYRIGNLMFHPREPRVIGVLDWELSTIGHPLLDLAYTVLMHHMPREVIALMGGSVELAPIPGIPSSDDLIERYCTRAKRARPADLRFYTALAFFRTAAIMQGIRLRIALGNAAGGADAERRAAVTPHLADLGWACARGA